MSGVLLNLVSQPFALPSGALGIWDASKGIMTSPRNTLKNLAVNGANDSNLLAFPRRNFRQAAQVYTNFGPITVTDGAQTAPDGTSDATSVVGSSSASWSIPYPSITLAAGTYTLALSARSLSGSTQLARLGMSNVGVSADQNITTAASRLLYTFTIGSPVTGQLFLEAPSSGASQPNIAIVDFELFAGASDLNINALTAAPLMVQNMDMPLGLSHFDTSTGRAGLMLNDTTGGYLSFSALQSLSAFTVIIGAKAVTTGPVNPSIIATPSSWSDFAVGFENVGPSTTNGPLRWLNSAPALTTAPTSNGGVSGCSWAVPGNGFATLVVRYDGAVLSTFVNGIKVQSCTTTLAGEAFKDLLVNQFQPGSEAGFNLGLLAFYTRAITDTEALQAHASLVGKFGKVGVKQLIGIAADSQTAVLPTWQSLIGPNLNPPRIISTQAIAGQTTQNAVTDQFPYLNAMLTNGPRQDKYILYFGLGTNNLAQNGESASTCLTNLAASIDAARTAGWQKVVAHTILPRGGTMTTYTPSTFETARQIVNSTMLGWVGGRLDAVADWGGQATIGAAGAYADTSLYQDLVHPTLLGHTTYLEPLCRAALNSV